MLMNCIRSFESMADASSGSFLETPVLPAGYFLSLARTATRSSARGLRIRTWAAQLQEVFYSG